MRNVILQGDIREIAKTIPTGSVNCIVTSPPYYGLRQYGHWYMQCIFGSLDDFCPSKKHKERWLTRLRWRAAERGGIFSPNRQTWIGALGLEPTPQLYIQHIVELFRELWRVLRDDGNVWLNLGDSFASSPAGNSDATFSKKQSSNNGSQARRKNSTLVGNLPPKNLLGIPWRVAFALQDDGWILRRDIIWDKCLSGGTVVYAKTQKGEMPTTIKDLVRLDPASVKLWTGEKWSQVISWKEVKPNPNRKLEAQKRRSRKNRTGEVLPLVGELEIHLRSGEKIGCTQEHKFPTQRGLVEAKDLLPGDVLQSCLLPEPEYPINPKYLPDDIGWLIGLYLAEGSRSGTTLQISGHTDEVERWTRLEKLANDYGDHFRLYTNGNIANAQIDGKMLIGIVDTYLNGELAKGKHLSPECWKRSNGFLSNVLQGYLDGDGHFEITNNRWRLGFAKNDALAQDLRTLSGRLGFSLRLKRTKHVMDGRYFDGWRGQIRFKQSNHFNSKSDTEIIKIEASRARKFWDIAIEDEPHLFALASGVLTHNSNPMPESVTDRPTTSHEYIFLLTKKPRYWYDAEAIKEPVAESTIERGLVDFGGEKGRNYNPTPNDPNFRNGKEQWGRSFDYTKSCATGRNKRSVWNIATQPYSGSHFATFPEALVEPCIRAGCPAQVCAECGKPWVRVVEKIGKSKSVDKRHGRVGHNGHPPQQSGYFWDGPTTQATNTFHPTCSCNAPTRPGVVLDPFFGSGTVGKVAIENGRDWLGVELNPDYIKLAEERLAGAQPALFVPEVHTAAAMPTQEALW